MNNLPLKFVDIKQNSDEWFLARAELLTSSNMSKVMVNHEKDGKFGEGAKKLAIKIALEQISGEPVVDGFKNANTDRGHEFEPKAVAVYESRHFCKVEPGGLYCNDKLGASPDGRVDGNLLEVKTREISAQLANIKRGGMEPVSKWQCISNLHFIGCEWLDFVTYNPAFPDPNDLFEFRLYNKDIKKDAVAMESRVEQFFDYVEEAKQLILRME